VNCPHCHTTLLMSERQGVEIDYCPDCRGVWLDRGELDKIIEKTAVPEGARRAPVAPPDHRDDRGQVWSAPPPPSGQRSTKKRTSRSVLSDIFDF
jgi:Zn-finger nucleic acid-binding protein